MAIETPAGPGVYVIGTDKTENMGAIYDALSAAGFVWRGQALSLNEGLRQLKLIKDQVHLIVVRAELARRDEEAALLEQLTPWPVVVLLGRSRTERQAAISQMPNVRAVLITPPYDFARLREISLEGVAPAAPTTPTPSAIVPAPAPAPVVMPDARPVSAVPSVALPKPTVRHRLAFYGTRGGVGTSTAAVRTARLLIGQGDSVAVVDVAGRGDLHLMLNGTPCAQPVTLDGITVYTGEPTESLARQHTAIIIDGGRQRGTFNAQWIEVNRPLDENALRRLVGLPPVNQAGVAQPARRLSLAQLISIEVTE